MKRFLLLVCLCVGLCACGGGGDAGKAAAVSSVIKVNADDYGGLAAAVSAIGSTPTVLIVSSSQTIVDNLTVPSNITLQVLNAASITINGGMTLTINGSCDAEPYQVFTGSGNVSGLKFATPEWFGAKGDGVTEDTAAIQLAVNSLAPGGYVDIPTKTYIVANIQLKSGVNIVGHGDGSVLKLVNNAASASHNGSTVDSGGRYAGNILGTTLTHDSGANADGGTRAKNESNSTYLVSNVRIAHLKLDGNNANNTLGDLGENASVMGCGVSINQASYVTVEDCTIVNNRLDGISLGYSLHGGSDYCVIKNCRFSGNTRCGISLITGKNNLVEGNTILHSGTGPGIDVEANLTDEVNYRHRIVNNYIQNGLAMVANADAKQQGVIAQGNTITATSGTNSYGIMVSNATIDGQSVITANKVVGTTSARGIWVIGEGDSPTTTDIVTLSNNDFSGFDFGLYTNAASIANFAVINNTFKTKFGLQLIRPYNNKIEGNTFNLTGGANTNAAIYVLFGQVGSYSLQGLNIIKGNTLSGDGVLRILTVDVGATPPTLTASSVILDTNVINLAYTDPVSISSAVAITLVGNRGL